MSGALLIRDAVILTGDAVGTAHPVGYLLIAHGRVAAVQTGSPPEDVAASAAEVVEGRGLVAIPGLVNAHTHTTLTLHRGICDDLDLFAWATHNYPSIRALTERDLRLGARWAALDLARAGITTTVECARYDPGVFADEALRVGLRCLSGGFALATLMGREVAPNWPALIERTASAMERFGGDRRARFFLGAHSPYNAPPELLEAVRAAADDLGVDLGIHLAETRTEVDQVAERYGVSPVQYLADHGWLNGRGHLLAAHVVWPDGERDVELLASAGAGVAHCATSNAKLASGVAPVPALRAAGIPVALGTDSVLSNNRLDLFAEMKAAALLQRARTGRADALTNADLFRMATLEGARAIGWNDEIGSLEVGKQADVVLLELEHPLGMTPERALSDVVWACGPDRVRHVLVAGEWVVRERATVQVDERAERAAICSPLSTAGVAAEGGPG